jgi:hypothetical protein
MRLTWLLFITTLVLFSFKSEPKNVNRSDNSYVIGQIPGLDSFETYNDLDQRMVSIGNSLVGQGGFKKNRSRIFMQTFLNGKQSSQDPAFYRGCPTPCYSKIENDTLKIKVGMGFFGGFGFEIKIYKDHFASNYFFYTDDVKPYKYNLSDKEFTDNLDLRNEVDSLILDEQPTFKPGQQLVGYLTFVSPVWYEKSVGEKMDASSIKGRIYFTCLTQQNGKY